MSTSIDRLASQIVRLEREVRAQATTPQLAYSSIEDSGAIDSNHDDGRTMAAFGGQFDGSFAAVSLNGPTPSTPSDPVVKSAIGGLTIGWDGLWANATFAPVDFTRIEIHVSTDPAFVPDMASTLVATIESPRGTAPFVALGVGAYYVAFVARSQSGAAGPASDTVGPTIVGKIDNASLSSPVVPGVGGASATNFAVSTTSTNVVSVAILIPDGFTQALVHVTAAASATNVTAVDDVLYVRAAITLPGGAVTNGAELYSFAPANKWGTASGSLAAIFSGLTPGSITVSAKVRAVGNWAANGVNLANVDASIVFLQ